MKGILDSLSGSLDSLVRQVEGTLSGPLNAVGSLIDNNVIAPIASAVRGALNTLTSAADAVGSSIETGIGTTLRSVDNGISSITSSVENGFTSAIQGVTGALSNVESSLVQQFNGVVTGVEQGFGAISSIVSSAVAAVGRDVGSAVTTLGSEIASTVREVVTPIASFIEQLPSDIATLVEKAVSAVEGVGSFVERIAVSAEKFAVGKLPEDILKTFEGATLDVIEPVTKELARVELAFISDILGVKASMLTPESIARIIAVASAETAIGVLEEAAPSAAYIISALLDRIAGSILVGEFREFTQAGNAGTPNQIFDVGSAITARFRGEITSDLYLEELSRHGFNASRAESLFTIAKSLLGTGQLVSLYRRGKISSLDELYAQAYAVQADRYHVDQLNALYDKLLGVGEAIELWRRGVLPDGWQTPFDDLIRDGVTPERADALKKISYKLPSIFEYQDFIARKVDDPAAVEKFGLEYGIDDAYLSNARANGYDEETARRVYRSYWNIPPFFLLASEYKAGTIGEQDMRDALAFQRFTPYWIDRFVADLAPKLTQADIKDMYKYQVIAADDIIPKLKSIGVTDTLAAELSTLWQASVKLAAPLDQTGAQTSAQKVKDDTGTLIKTAYKDGILTKNDAMAKLKALKYTDDAASLTLDIVDYETTQTAIKDTFTQVKDAYASRSITLNDALNALQAAGASPQQMLTYNAELTKGSATKTRSPTLAEFGSWFKKGIINAAEYANGLSLLGYADVWIPFFMLADGVPIKDIQALGLDVTDVLQSQ